MSEGVTTEDQPRRRSKRNPLEEHANTPGNLVWKRPYEGAVPETGNEEEIEHDRAHEGTSRSSLHVAMPPSGLWPHLGGDVMSS